MLESIIVTQAVCEFRIQRGGLNPSVRALSSRIYIYIRLIDPRRNSG